MDIIKDKALLIIGLALILIFIIFLFYVFYLNIGSTQSTTLLYSRVFLPVLLATSLITYQLFLPIDRIKSNTSFVIVRKGTIIYPITRVISKKENLLPQGYFDLIHNTLRMENKGFGDPTIETQNEETIESVLDLVEFTLIEWLSKNYPFHWQMEQARFVSFNGSVVTGSRKDDAIDEGTRITPNKIERIFHENIFMGKAKSMIGFALPPKSAVSIQRKPRLRKIIIENPWATFSISIEINHGVIFSSGHPEDYFLREYGIENAWQDHVSISTEGRLTRLRRWSPLSEMVKSWMIDVGQQIEADFDWEKIREEIYSSIPE